MSFASLRTALRRSASKAALRAVGTLLVAGTIASCEFFDAEIIDDVAERHAISPALSGALNSGRSPDSVRDLRQTNRPVDPNGTGTARVPLRKMPELLGGDQADILTVLGKPNIRINNLSAQLWRYTDTACAFDLLFFFDVVGDRYRLALIQRNGLEIGLPEVGQCISEISQSDWVS